MGAARRTALAPLAPEEPPVHAALTRLALAATLLVIPALAVAADPPTPPTAPAAPAAAAPATPATPATPAPPSPVSGIRSKLSAADLLSAESILEVHEQKNGRDGPWVEGLGWLARGAWMLGDRDKAKRYADAANRECETRVAGGADLDKESGLAGALGASIEVEAQIRQRADGVQPATRYLDEQLARWPKPVSLRSRLNKRRNLMTLVGARAPELAVEDHSGPAPQPLASLRGKPVVLFLWAEWCGDCKVQAAALARVKAKYAERGLEVVALTRYYGDEPRAAEKARVDSMWTAVYPAVGEIPRVFSTASMERYGGSATPTFVFVDREGVVRDYTPTRLTEEELDRRVAAIAR